MSVRPGSAPAPAPAPDAPDRLALALRVGAHVAAERGLSILHADDGAPVDLSVDPRKYLRKTGLYIRNPFGGTEKTGKIDGVPGLIYSIKRDVNRNYMLVIRDGQNNITMLEEKGYAFTSMLAAARVVQLTKERLAAAIVAFQTGSLEMLKVAQIPLTDSDPAFERYGMILYDIAQYVATHHKRPLTRQFQQRVAKDFTPLVPQRPTASSSLRAPSRNAPPDVELEPEEFYP